jgi:hypothetical protein
MRPLFIDIEASGLGRGSYPIEVGIALACGGTACMIIRPESDWEFWDDEAEKLHGISRETLTYFGRPPLDAAKFLNQLIAKEVAYSDAWGNDSCWLALLFECAGIAQHFKLDSLRSLLSEEQAAIWHEVKDSVIADNPFPRHRASNDALILQHSFCRTVERVKN